MIIGRLIANGEGVGAVAPSSWAARSPMAGVGAVALAGDTPSSPARTSGTHHDIASIAPRLRTGLCNRDASCLDSGSDNVSVSLLGGIQLGSTTSSPLVAAEAGSPTGTRGRTGRHDRRPGLGGGDGPLAAARIPNRRSRAGDDVHTDLHTGRVQRISANERGCAFWFSAGQIGRGKGFQKGPGC